MKVILREHVDQLGERGEIVTVAAGYARNYLLPQGKAIPATPQNRRVLEQERAKFELQIAKERKLADKKHRGQLKKMRKKITKCKAV